MNSPDAREDQRPMMKSNIQIAEGQGPAAAGGVSQEGTSTLAARKAIAE
jgi:hypothetical protein